MRETCPVGSKVLRPELLGGWDCGSFWRWKRLYCVVWEGKKSGQVKVKMDFKVKMGLSSEDAGWADAKMSRKLGRSSAGR